MKKRIFALLLAAALGAALLTGCGGDDSGSGSAAAPTPTPQPINVYDYNPLTGLDKADDLPDGQRPVAIMINNVQAALPQTGIGSADVIYEMETEGGITRMMAVYSDYTKVPLVGPGALGAGPVRPVCAAPQRDLCPYRRLNLRQRDAQLLPVSGHRRAVSGADRLRL